MLEQKSGECERVRQILFDAYVNDKKPENQDYMLHLANCKECSNYSHMIWKEWSKN